MADGGDNLYGEHPYFNVEHSALLRPLLRLTRGAEGGSPHPDDDKHSPVKQPIYTSSPNMYSNQEGHKVQFDESTIPKTQIPSGILKGLSLTNSRDPHQ